MTCRPAPHRAGHYYCKFPPPIRLLPQLTYHTGHDGASICARHSRTVQGWCASTLLRRFAGRTLTLHALDLTALQLVPRILRTRLCACSFGKGGSASTFRRRAVQAHSTLLWLTPRVAHSRPLCPSRHWLCTLSRTGVHPCPPSSICSSGP